MAKSKRHVEELSKVYTSIFADATYAYPALRDEFSKDFTRLLELVDARGIRIYFVDLPAIGKHLDRCLANGEYKCSGLPLTGRISDTVQIPKFLRGLYLLVFDKSGHLLKDASHEAIYFLRQISYAAKKADFACDFNLVEDEILDFVKVDAELPRPEMVWEARLAGNDSWLGIADFSDTDRYRDRARVVDSESSDSGSMTTSFLRTLDRVSNIISATLGSFNPQEWKFKHGPGAISEVTGPTNKFNWRNWSETLESVFPIADSGFHHYSSWAAAAAAVDKGDRCLTSIESSSRLVAVPKTFTKPRLIAAEPSEHQWCQQNVWHFLKTRVTKSWLSEFVGFTDQTRNQEMCMRGSRDGSLATVDLSSASDRVTCLCVSRMFRRNTGLLSALRATRTRFVSQTLTPKAPGLIELRKFSTMGSACTFPVESLIFLSIAISACLTVRKLAATMKNIRSLSGEVSVYGDDIVIPTDSRLLLFTALEVLDFKVNLDKSYWTGRFRESCGIDSYDGVNVTPIYWKMVNDGSPEALDSTISVANNFYSKFMLHTASYLSSTTNGFNIPSVSMASGVRGRRTRVGPIANELNTRWNDALQRFETSVTRLNAKVERLPISDDSALLQYFTEAPGPLTKWVGGVTQRPRLRNKTGWVSSDEIVA